MLHIRIIMIIRQAINLDLRVCIRTFASFAKFHHKDDIAIAVNLVPNTMSKLPQARV